MGEKVTKRKRFYCPDCDELREGPFCPECGGRTDELFPLRRATLKDGAS